MAMARRIAENVYDRARADGFVASLSQRGARWIVHVKARGDSTLGEEINSPREYHAFRDQAQTNA